MVVKELISLGADLDLVGDKPPVTPLCEAASREYEDIMALLVDSGANINGGVGSKSPLGMAAMTGRLWAVKFLIEHGADINQADAFDDSTPLHMASKGCQLGVAVWLLDKGAKATTKDKNGNVPEALVCTGDLSSIKPHEIAIRKRRLQEILSTGSKVGNIGDYSILLIPCLMVLCLCSKFKSSNHYIVSPGQCLCAHCKLLLLKVIQVVDISGKRNKLSTNENSVFLSTFWHINFEVAH